MTEELKLTITKNLDYLAANTSNLDKVLNILLENLIIDFADYEKIKNVTEGACARNTELYLTILKRDDFATESLLESFTASGNWAISKRLMSDNGVLQIWFEVRMPSNFFEGRDMHIQKIHHLSQHSLESKKSCIIILSGLGGVGKTEIVTNYARKFFEESEGHCISINAETVESQIESFKRLAGEMSISCINSSGDEKEMAHLVDDIFDKLWDTKCLLIFDNVDNFEEPIFEIIQKLLGSQSPETIRPVMIITSRCKPTLEFFNDAIVEKMAVDPLTMDSAVKFISQALDENTSANVSTDVSGTLQNICVRLNCFPLALQQAVAYLNASYEAIPLDEKLKQFLNLLDNDSIKCLNFPTPGQYSSTTYLTLKCTLEKLKKYPAVILLIKTVAFFSADSISIPFIISVVKSKSETLSESSVLKAIHLLNDYSLISTNWQNNTMSIHRLVQEILRIHLESENESKDTLDKLLTILKKNDFFSGNQIENQKHDQICNLRSTWNYANKFPDLVKKHCDFPEIICEKYEMLGLFRECEDFTRISLEKLGSEMGAVNILWLKYWRGCALEGLGKLEEALVLLGKTYEEANANLGIENDLTLRCAHVNGSVLWRQGKNEEAMNWYEMALALREKKFGSDNEHTLVLKNDMALLMVDEEKYEEALQLYADLLKIRGRIMGIEHSETLTVKHNIGWTKCCQKNFSEALTILEETLEAKLRVLHYDHPNVLSTKHVMGRTLKEMGRYEEALEILTDTYNGRQRVLGSDHPNTINSKKLVEEIREIDIY